jgi:hypothetical protein
MTEMRQIETASGRGGSENYAKKIYGGKL